MSKKRILAIAILAVSVTALVVVPAVARRSGQTGGGMGRRGGMCRGGGPAFTEEQKEQIEEIRAGFEDERVELSNRMKVMHLEMRELVTSDDPDFGDLEDMIDEITELQGEMMKLRLRQHLEVREILTDDQRVLFDKGFGMRMGQGGAGGPGCGVAGPGGPGMSGGGLPGCGGMMGRRAGASGRVRGGAVGGIGICPPDAMGTPGAMWAPDGTPLAPPAPDGEGA